MIDETSSSRYIRKLDQIEQTSERGFYFSFYFPR